MQRRVLILCTGNSARSQMAEALINHRRRDTWRAFSAGTNPAPRVHPAALAVLREIGIDTEGSRPTPIDAYTGQVFDVVITVCDDAAENCPYWSGQGQRVHIGFPDPAKASGSDDEIFAAFRAVRDDIERRVLPFLDSYPVNNRRA